MLDSISTNEKEHDDTILKVRGKSTNQSGKEYIKQLSSAISTVIYKHGHAKLKAVGAPSVNNAVKASILAIGDAKKKGIDLVLSPSFGVATFDESEKTAILLTIHKSGESV